MPHALRHLCRASRLLPATLASLTSLFALAPAETAVNRFLHRPPQAGSEAAAPALPSGLLLRATQYGPHEDPALRLLRYAYKPHAPRDAAQPGCPGDACFDPEDFAPAAGAPPHHDGGEGAGRFAQQPGEDAHEPPARPSSEPVEIASLDSFAPGHGARADHRGEAHGGSGGTPGAGGGAPRGEGSFDHALLPGGFQPGNAGSGGSAPGEQGGPEPGGGNGRSEGGHHGFGPGAPSPGGANPGGSNHAGANQDDASGGGEAGDSEPLSLRAAPPAAAIDVASPASATLLAAATASLLALGRRRATA